MREAYAATTVSLFRDDPRVAIVLAEISRDLLREAFRHDPTRAINVGIAEQTMVGVAAGFALEGFHPIAHSLAPFMAERPYEQLKLDFGYQGLGGTFIGAGGSYDYGSEGGTHHAAGDVAALLAIPRMQVLAPGHPSEVEQLLRATYANGRPTYVRTTSPRTRTVTTWRPAGCRCCGAARPDRRRLRADARPHARGRRRARRDRRLRHVGRPFDARGLAALAGAQPDVVAVEPWYEGSSATALTAALGHLPARYRFVGVPRRFLHAYGTREELDADLGLDGAGIRRRLVGQDGRGSPIQ